ncbi:uncharacterized protein LOC123297714 [Chrysoperla carnea]|uniref:uncharacterized protein LOC123297714 n=1 Tax=Chrysoperla carnea TaxID=189513 RepID=UPI001D069E34|nr:uncharacterized protein LOC123297714 [Chrysoperla carnea]
MNENCNETLSNYLTKTYYLPQSTGHKTIDLIIPKCFLSLDKIDHLIAVTKPFLKHVIWKDSELDDFYHKPTGRFERNLKSQFFKDENLLLNLESTVVSSATSITCGDFLDNSTAKNYKTSLVTEIFKKRFLAIFNFKSMESIVKEIVDLSAHMKTEIPTDVETKQSKGLKKGRPRKKLPGGRFKYEREEGDDEEDLYNNQIKTEQNKLLTKNIKEELMSETSQNV